MGECERETEGGPCFASVLVKLPVERKAGQQVTGGVYAWLCIDLPEGFGCNVGFLKPSRYIKRSLVLDLLIRVLSVIGCFKESAWLRHSLRHASSCGGWLFTCVDNATPAKEIDE
jgi:hypothetical protein